MTERENALLAIAHKQPRWLPSSDVFMLIDPPDVERPLRSAGEDMYGVKWSLPNIPNALTYHDDRLPPVLEDVTEWRETVRFFDLSQLDWEKEAEKAKHYDRENKLILCRCMIGLFERVQMLMRFEDALVSFLTEPEEMEALVSAIADQKIKQIHYYAKYIKPDVIKYQDDWGNQRDTFLSPKLWREIIKPHTKRIYDAIHECGMMVMQHSCGKVESLVPDMVEMGAEMWQSCQSCNDLARLKEEYGDKITFVGALDDQKVLDFPDVSDEMIEKEIRDRVTTLAPGGGFIIGPNGTSLSPERAAQVQRLIAKYAGEVYG